MSINACAIHVLSLPLTLMIKNDTSLNEIKNVFSNLSEWKTKIVISSSDENNLN